MTTNAQPAPPVASKSAIVMLLCIDAVLIVIFAIIGVSSHDGDLNFLNIARVALPFTLPYLVLSAIIKPGRLIHNVFPAGIALWLITVVLGLILRAILFDDSSALAFILVTTGVLGVFLLGRRSISTLVNRQGKNA
ncbi:MAG TPA: DUF3054 domain-containing protein [Candidatus Yaniella excrementavium]|nr:DUF3054 domain-containing protein [Candidatus Yaniella excrementavium]